MMKVGGESGGKIEVQDNNAVSVNCRFGEFSGYSVECGESEQVRGRRESFNKYISLIQLGGLDIGRCECQKENIEIFLSKEIFESERKNANKDREFVEQLIKNIRVIVGYAQSYCDDLEQNVYNKDFQGEGIYTISNFCYKLILFIDEEYRNLNNTINLVQQKLAEPNLIMTERIWKIFQKIFIRGLRDPLVNELLARAYETLENLKNLSKVYLSYIIYDPDVFLKLGEIVLFWKEGVNAIAFFNQVMKDNIVEGDEYDILIKSIWEILDRYEKEIGFHGETDEELIKFYEEIRSIVSPADDTDIEGDYEVYLSSEDKIEEAKIEETENGNENGIVLPMLQRTVSCHNAKELFGKDFKF